jgi:hypothetical protein
VTEAVGGVVARQVKITINGASTGTEAREVEVYGVPSGHCP